MLGPEFVADTGKKDLVMRALYELKSAELVFRNHFADCMVILDYTSCFDDHDV